MAREPGSAEVNRGARKPARTKSATNSNCRTVSRPDQGGLRGEVRRGLPAGHGDLRLQVAIPMKQDQPKQGLTLAAVEGAAVVAVDKRVDALRITCGEETHRAQCMRFEGSNRTARRPMMSIRGREPHDRCRAPSLLEERPTHPATLAGGSRNKRALDGASSPVPVRAGRC